MPFFFGFSRGATGTRNYISDALSGHKTWLPDRRVGNVDPSTSIYEPLQKIGYEITGPGSKTGVKVCFAGLYDTVSKTAIFHTGAHTPHLSRAERIRTITSKR